MVRVIVEDADTARFPDQLEAAAHALEPGKAVEHDIGLSACLDGCQQCTKSVEGHVPTRYRQPHRPRLGTRRAA